LIEPITIDFETEAIVGNPLVNPPKPVGCAVWVPGEEPVYYSWGSLHGDNNITWAQFHAYLERIRDSGMPLLFHNAGFDISVWNASFCNARVLQHSNQWILIHDTMYLIFLADPYSNNFSLKPSADRFLGMPPSEQDALTDWIVANVPECGSRKEAGAYICRAPVSLVSPYAIGDVVRTRKLFDYLYAQIEEKDMVAAYDRERRLLPILMGGTSRGIRVARDLLAGHLEAYESCEAIASERLSSILGSNAFDSDDCLADALERCGAVTEWVLTPKSGKRSMSKENLRIVRPDVKILLDYKNRLDTCIQMFMRPWMEYSAADGRLHPNWNQVRQSRGDTFFSKGARTGRLSSDSPNFQNVPTEFVDKQGNPLPVPEGLYPLPQLRAYCLPEVGHVWLKRDFSSQEIRILAHFEDGSLCEAYRANPSLDPHQMAKELIAQMIGMVYARKDIKITGFSIIYGTGGPGLSGQLGCPVEEARSIKAAYLDAMPGVRDLMWDVQARGRRGEAIRTWGGRLYIAEPAKIIDGKWRDFAYKLLNYLIQGSAADQTKESICDWEDARSWEAIFLATVHDEINISAPREAANEHMKILRQTMDADRFDVPMRSEGFIGENWAELKEWDDEKERPKVDVNTSEAA
jgi:DNA polymerase I-like protein with 3'-5' exonuclease and polymerase domains